MRGPSVQTLHKYPTSNPTVLYRGSPLVNVAGPANVEPVIPFVERAVPSHRQSSIMRPYHAQPCLSSSPLRQEPPSENALSAASNCDGSPPFRQSFSVAPIQPLDDQGIPQRESARGQEHISSTLSINRMQLDPPSSSLPATALSGPAVTEKSASSVASSTPAPANSHQETLQSILAGLGEAASIYDLSNTALEQIIGEIIQEDKFLQLVSHIIVYADMLILEQVEKISEMTSIRRVANI